MTSRLGGRVGEGAAASRGGQHVDGSAITGARLGVFGHCENNREGRDVQTGGTEGDVEGVWGRAVDRTGYPLRLHRDVGRGSAKPKMERSRTLRICRHGCCGSVLGVAGEDRGMRSARIIGRPWRLFGRTFHLGR